MSAKEATARIKINKLLEAAGLRFFAEGSAPANIRLESNATIRSSYLDARVPEPVRSISNARLKRHAQNTGQLHLFKCYTYLSAVCKER